MNLPLSIQTTHILNLTTGNHFIFVSPSTLAVWSLPDPAKHDGETIPVTNQTATTNLNINVQGGLPAIYIWGSTTLNTNVVPNSTTYFKSGGTYWYTT